MTRRSYGLQFHRDERWVHKRTRSAVPSHPLLGGQFSWRDQYDGGTVHADVVIRATVPSIYTKSKRTIPVAMLSTADFDAPSEVDKNSLMFGSTGEEGSLAFCTTRAEDVNGDGLLDQVCHFNTRDTGFQQNDTEGILKGQTVGGVPIEGRDAVRIVN